MNPGWLVSQQHANGAKAPAPSALSMWSDRMAIRFRHGRAEASQSVQSRAKKRSPQ